MGKSGTSAEEYVLAQALARGYLTGRQLLEARGVDSEQRERGQASSLLAAVGKYLDPRQRAELARLHEAALANAEDHVATVRPTAETVAPSGGSAIRTTHEGPSDPRPRAMAALRAAFERDPTFAPHVGLAFERLARLGEGGMGVVHRVRDRRLGREAALKVLKGRADPRMVQRFRREARITARLDHPSIPPVYEAGTDGDDNAYMLMRVIEGDTLTEHIAKLHATKTPFADRAALRDLLDALIKSGDAVAYAHSHGVIHRDLKPDNIMLGPFGEVLVMDWGLAKVTGEEEETAAGGELKLDSVEAKAAGLTQSGSVLGTPGYMAPEQARGEEVDQRADVFALGAILVELLTGRPPVTGETAINRIVATVKGKIVTPRQRRGDVPRELDSIASRALAMDPKGRYATAGALVSDLKGYLAGGDVAAHTYSLGERLRRAAHRHPTALAGVSATVVAVVISVGASLWLVQASAARRLAGAVAAANARVLTKDPAASLDAARAALTSDGGRVVSRTPEAKERTALIIQRLQALSDAYGEVLRLDPKDPSAREGRYEALVALGRLAQLNEDFTLGSFAFQQASQLGVDDTTASELADGVATARRALLVRHRDRIEEILRDAQAGGLRSEESPEYRQAVLELASYREGQTVELLVAFLDGVSERLRAARADCLRSAVTPTQGEAAAGLKPLEGVEELIGAWNALRPGEALEGQQLQLAVAAVQRLQDRRYRGLGVSRPLDVARVAPLGLAQLEALGEPTLHTATAVCEALGLLGQREGAAESLERYVWSQDAPPRAVAAGRALFRLGGDEPLAFLMGSREHFGDTSTYWQQIGRLLASVDATPELTTQSALDYQERGYHRFSQGDNAGAIDDLDEALRLDPSLSGARIAKAMALGNMARSDAALLEYERVLASEPKNAFALFNRGSLYKDLGRLDEAQADLERALSGEPRAYGVLAMVRADRGDLRGALRDIDQALLRDPSNCANWINRGWLNYSLNQLEAAVIDYGKALELEPDHPVGLMNRANALRDLGRLDEALHDVDRVLARNPRDPRALSTRAMIHQDSQRWEAALRDYDQVIALEPESAAAWINRGFAFYARGDFAHAIKDYDRALAVAPDNELSLLNRGCAYQALGGLTEARADFERLVTVHPTSALGWSSLASLKAAVGDLDGALADETRALELNPTNVNSLNNRGLTQIRRGDFEEALPDLNRALVLDPRHVLALCNRAKALASLGRRKPALLDVDAALKLNPQEFEAWLTRAQILHAEGRLEEATESAERCVAIQPSNPVAHAAHARILLSRVEVPLAAVWEANERALALDSKASLPRFVRALLLGLKGRRAEARAEIDEIVAAHPEEGPALWQWKHALGGPPARLNPEAPAWTSTFARALRGKATAQQVVAEFERQEGANVGVLTALVHAVLGAAAEGAGDRTRARTHYRAAIATKTPNDASFAWARRRLEALKD